MKVTRRQLRKLISEELQLSEMLYIQSAPLILKSTIESLQVGLDGSISAGTLHSDVTIKQYLKFMNIFYRSHIDRGHGRKYLIDFEKQKKISLPITGKMIDMMTKELGLTPMTSEDWERFYQIFS